MIFYADTLDDILMKIAFMFMIIPDFTKKETETGFALNCF